MKSNSKKETLFDLSQKVPTAEEFERMISSLDSLDARSLVLSLTSFVEKMLEAALALNFRTLGKTRHAALFRDPGAPLNSFSAKIKLGHALAIYSDEMTAYLNRFRSLRNAFAHSMQHDLDFEHPLIGAECNKLDLEKLVKKAKYVPEKDTPRERFTIFGVLAAMHLMQFIKAKKDSEPLTPFSGMHF